MGDEKADYSTKPLFNFSEGQNNHIHEDASIKSLENFIKNQGEELNQHKAIIAALYSKIDKINKENEQLKAETTEKKAELKGASEEYINPIISKLSKISLSLQQKAKINFNLGWIFIAIAIVLVIGEFITYLVCPCDGSQLIIRSSRLLMTVLLCAALSRYFYTLGRSYMRESIKHSDRIHVLNFGKFFLQAFGDPLEHEYRKGIFEEWNVNAKTPFDDLKSKDIDPQITEIIKAYASKTEKKDKSE